LNYYGGRAVKDIDGKPKVASSSDGNTSSVHTGYDDKRDPNKKIKKSTRNKDAIPNEPVKAEPAKAEPTKAEPAKVTPAKSTPAAMPSQTELNKNDDVKKKVFGFRKLAHGK